MMKYPTLEGVAAGNKKGTSVNIMELYRRFAEEDSFGWYPEGVFANKGNLSEELTLASGSRYTVLTAGSSDMGRSGTVQCAHLTEVGFWERGESSKSDPALAFMSSVYTEGPETLVMMESTPNGTQGYFYRSCLDAMEGRGTWKFIFTAWFEFDDSATQFVTPDQRQEFEESLTEDEKEEIARFPVTLEQMNWRRTYIQDKCEGDPAKFRQECPSDAMECFLTSARPRFPVIVMDELMKNAVRPTNGDLTMQDNGQASFLRDPQGLWKMFDEPKEGLSYLIGVDTCTGEDQQQQNQFAPDPDYHSIQVWRAGYEDWNGEYHLPRLVAIHHSRFDIGDLTSEIASIASYFGNPLVIPEVNGSGLALVKLLQALYPDVRIYRRKKINDSTAMVEKFYGWNTDKTTRKTVIDHFAAMLLKNELDIPAEDLLREMRTFLVNKQGRPEAAAGCHDDHVMCAAITVYNLESATPMKGRVVRRMTNKMLEKDPTLMCPDGYMRKKPSEIAKASRGQRLRRRNR
jgi:hypothetical protein